MAEGAETADMPEGHPHCCGAAGPEEEAGGSHAPELPVCPHSVAVSGCATSGALHAGYAEPTNLSFPNHLPFPAVSEAPVSVPTAPPFEPPRA